MSRGTSIKIGSGTDSVTTAFSLFIELEAVSDQTSAEKKTVFAYRFNDKPNKLKFEQEIDSVRAPQSDCRLLFLMRSAVMSGGFGATLMLEVQAKSMDFIHLVGPTIHF